MKLYLWRRVLSDYTDGCAFAIAESVEAALKQLRQTGEWEPASTSWMLPVDPAEWPAPEVHDLDKPLAFWRYGGG